MGFKGMLGGLGVLLSRRGRSPFAGEAFYSRMPETLKQIVAKVDCPGYILRSWQIIDQCITQLDPFAYVITDRFHGHILCTIREITHTVIGNNHHKIRAHWETWSKSFESVTFADSTDSVRNLLANRAVNA
jgi:exopolysaccharide biosynthesis predicted pyruvyltransferase EpsI